MKLLIFGATGATGQLLVQQAITNGYQVTAFVRNASKLTLTHKNLRVVSGDVLHPASISPAMKEQDAVLCCIGAPANKAKQLRSQGTKNILACMEKAGIERFICQTSLGFNDSERVLKNTGFVFRNIIVPLLLKTTFAEHAIQEATIMNSTVNWTIVRPGNMTSQPLTKQYKHGFAYTDPSIKVKIARADVAHFMLAQIGSNTYQRKIAGISY